MSEEKVSIITLIYKSVDYLEFLVHSLKKYTPQEHEFLVVANNATEEVKNKIREMDLNWIENKNYVEGDHYLRNAYRALNEGIKHTSGDIVVFVNSDMAFSKDWLPNLLKSLKKGKTVISGRLVESGNLPSGCYGISKNFGKHPSEFKAEEFERFAEQIKIKDHLRPWGMFAPIAYYKEDIMRFDGYPHGNLKYSFYGQDINMPGDVALFGLMATKGILLYTAFDSIVYHFQEGEKREEDFYGSKGSNNGGERSENKEEKSSPEHSYKKSVTHGC